MKKISLLLSLLAVMGLFSGCMQEVEKEETTTTTVENVEAPPAVPAVK